MRKMNIDGYDCDIDTSLSEKELHNLASSLIEGYSNKGTAGLAISYPRKIYVAHDVEERGSTLLHEIIEQVFFTLPTKLKKKLGKDKEDFVLALEKGIHSGYKSVGHKLPDPCDLTYVKTDGRYL